MGRYTNWGNWTECLPNQNDSWFQKRVRACENPWSPFHDVVSCDPAEQSIETLHCEPGKVIVGLRLRN